MANAKALASAKSGMSRDIRTSRVGERESNCRQPAAALHHALNGGPLGRAIEYREDEDSLSGCADCSTLPTSKLTHGTTAPRGAPRRWIDPAKQNAQWSSAGGL